MDIREAIADNQIRERIAAMGVVNITLLRAALEGITHFGGGGLYLSLIGCLVSAGDLMYDSDVGAYRVYGPLRVLETEIIEEAKGNRGSRLRDFCNEAAGKMDKVGTDYGKNVAIYLRRRAENKGVVINPARFFKVKI